MGIFSGLPIFKKFSAKVRRMSDIAHQIRQLDALSNIAWLRGDHDEARALRARANVLRAQPLAQTPQQHNHEDNDRIPRMWEYIPGSFIDTGGG